MLGGLFRPAERRPPGQGGAPPPRPDGARHRRPFSARPPEGLRWQRGALGAVAPRGPVVFWNPSAPRGPSDCCWATFRIGPKVSGRVVIAMTVRPEWIFVSWSSCRCCCCPLYPFEGQLLLPAELFRLSWALTGRKAAPGKLGAPGLPYWPRAPGGMAALAAANLATLITFEAEHLRTFCKFLDVSYEE